MIVRPSSNSTRSESLVQRTFLTRSPGCTSIILVPPFDEICLTTGHESLDPSQFRRTKPQIPRQRNRHKPELRGEIIPVHVNVGRFGHQVMAVEVEPIRSDPKHRRHDPNATLVRSRVNHDANGGLGLTMLPAFNARSARSRNGQDPVHTHTYTHVNVNDIAATRHQRPEAQGGWRTPPPPGSR